MVGQHAILVLGMDESQPGLRIVEPELGRRTEHFLDLWAHIKS
jgi:hypothetical protein